MTFDAGSVTGSLHFDLSEYTHSMIDAESLMQTFPPIILECLENPMLAAIEVFKEAADAFKDTIADVGNEAQSIGLAAEKAGVSVQWFSEMVNVGKAVNISNEQLSTGFKFLQRTASDAAEGVNAQAGRAFSELGLSAQFLQSHLNDTRGLFEAVQERIQALPSAAQRTQAAMEVLGRSGSDLVPLFEMSRQSMQGLIDEAHRLGAVENEESAKMGQQWGIVTATVSEAWEGLKRKLAEPILDYITSHMDEFQHLIESLADSLASMIPAALEVAQAAVLGLIDLLRSAVWVLEEIGGFTDAIGLTDGLKDGLDGVGDSLAKIHDTLGSFDVKKAFEGVGKQDAISVAAAQPSSDAPWTVSDDLARKAPPPYTAAVATDNALGTDFSDPAVYGAPADIRSRSSGSGDANLGGGQYDGSSGIIQASILRVDASAWSAAADAFRPVLFEMANAIESAYIKATAPAASDSSASGTAKSPSSAPPAVEVQIAALNVAGLDASSIADAIARQIAPQIKNAFTRQEQAAQAAARHSKVESAVAGTGD